MAGLQILITHLTVSPSNVMKGNSSDKLRLIRNILDQMITKKLFRSTLQNGLAYFQIESLIPLKDDRDLKSELEKKRGDSYRSALDEHTELVQQLTGKNRHLKEIIDQMRSIIWEINTMLAMREQQ